MKKRGQITLFMILGIALLSAVSLILYIQSTTIEERLVPELVPSLTEIPLEVRPIREYTENCIFQLSEEALRKIGFHGGYINPADFGILTDQVIPTESDGVKYPDSDLEVPYWWYLKSENDCEGNCEFSSLRPSLYRVADTGKSIEAQVDEYVNSNLDECLLGFEPFVEQGFSIEEQGDVKTTTIVGDLDVSIFVDYPLKVSRGDVSYEFELFYVSLPVNFKKVYEFATEVANSEINYTFLERQVLNMVTALADLDDESLPPLTESTFEFGAGRMWNVIDVKKDIEGLLMTYIPGLQVFNTLNYNRNIFTGNDLRQSLYDQMVLPLNIEGEYDNLAARFDYLGWWPIYFNAGHGGIIQPESTLSSYLMIGWQRYSTAYDISFPTVVTITEPDAFNGKGYTFMFALEGNIRNNEAIDGDFAGLRGAYEFQSSLLCNLNQRNSGEITIRAIDARDDKGLEDVQITYTCGAESCFVGTTDEDGMMRAKFPICHNGIVSFLKSDHFSASQYLTTSLDKEDTIPLVKMYPYAEKEIDVMKYGYDASNNVLSANVFDLGQDEDAVISFTKVKDTPGETDIAAGVQISGSQEDLPIVRIVPGVYEIDIRTFLHKPVVIPEEKRKTGAGFIGSVFGADEEYTIPEVVFDDNYPSGGAIFDEKTGYVVISANNLYSDNKILFYTISPSLPSKIEDLERINKLEEYSSIFRQSIEPAFVR